MTSSRSLNPEIFTELDKFIDSNSHLINPSSDTINLKDFRARSEVVRQLQKLISDLDKIKSKVKTTLSNMNSAHEKDIHTVEKLIAETEPANWTVVKRKPATTPAPKKQPARTTPRIGAGAHPLACVKRVKFTEALGLTAIEVPSFESVKSDGELYYVFTTGHFAFRLSGQLFHGNIGRIYTDEKNPDKIKDCKFADDCVKKDTCNYYHDPVKFATSKDTRNFIASSWLYTMPGSMRKRAGSRRFGSRDHLDTDIAGLCDDEVNRFRDQAMHDILCALLLRASASSSS